MFFLWALKLQPFIHIFKIKFKRFGLSHLGYSWEFGPRVSSPGPRLAESYTHRCCCCCNLGSYTHILVPPQIRGSLSRSTKPSSCDSQTQIKLGNSVLQPFIVLMRLFLDTYTLFSVSVVRERCLVVQDESSSRCWTSLIPPAFTN